MLDESLCGDPLMYATFVAPVHQYSTETEPSRQASFNYPSRQPSFKQNSSEADGSQPDILQSQALGAGGAASSAAAAAIGAGGNNHLGVPSVLRTSLTPERAVYVPADEVQDIYTEVPAPEWPLPPPPRVAEMQKNSDQDCVEISQEELERQVNYNFNLCKLAFYEFCSCEYFVT